MMMHNRISHIKDSRVVASQMLKDILLAQSSLSQLDKYNSHLSTQDKALAQALCYGCCRYYEILYACSTQLLHKPLKEKDYDILALMLLGCYQLAYMRIPAHAAINSTVEACRLIGKNWACKMLNAVLRNFQRRQEPLLAAWHAKKQPAHPEWLIADLQTDWPHCYQEIIQANNQHPPMCLRLAPQLDRETYQAQLNACNIASSNCQHSLQGIRLQQAYAIEQLPAFTDGLVSIQDEGAQLAALLLDAQPGERILDACSAPGNKACHILELAAVDLLALDIDAVRCKKITANLDRLNLQAGVKTADATNLDSWWDKKYFDRILLDAPCSATGVIRRHPDIKLLRRKTDIAAMAALQYKLLKNLWQTLKPGGRLLYATCSILQQENDCVLSAFLATQANAKNIAIAQHWGIALNYGRQLLPSDNGPDGFYYALLEKDLDKF